MPFVHQQGDIQVYISYGLVPCLRMTHPSLEPYSGALLLTVRVLRDSHVIMMQGAPWCFTNDAWTLSTEYLIEWGSRWGPYMKIQPYRCGSLLPLDSLSFAHPHLPIIMLASAITGRCQSKLEKQKCPKPSYQVSSGLGFTRQNPSPASRLLPSRAHFGTLAPATPCGERRCVDGGQVGGSRGLKTGSEAIRERGGAGEGGLCKK